MFNNAEIFDNFTELSTKHPHRPTLNFIPTPVQLSTEK